MTSLMFTLFVTLVASLSLTALVRILARQWGIIDNPDGRRKLHGQPTPLLGGVAVYGATVLGLLVIRFGFGSVSNDFIELSTAWIIAAGFVCFVGSIDDRFDLPARVKLGLQILSVLPIVMLGHNVDRIVAFGCPIDLGWFGTPLTVLWLIGCINALNLIDGMDGLASIVGLSTAAMMGVIAASEGHAHVAIIAMILAASIVGFLIYNLPPASIFLGDSGSMVIGLSVGLLGMQGTLKTSATLAITAPAVVMTLPMFDILAAVVRRKMTGRPLDAPDRLHIHHRLLDRGWTPWQVLCLIGAICLTTGAAATAATIFRRDVLAWVAAITLIVLMIRLRLFGYEEFAMLKEATVRFAKLLIGLPARLAGIARSNRAWLRVQDAEASLPHVLSTESQPLNPILWDILLQNLREWDVRQVDFCVTLDDQIRRIRWIDPSLPENSACRWSVSVSLPDPNGELCELRVAGPQPGAHRSDSQALASLLRAFGNQFAAHTEQLFGPPVAVEVPETVDTYPSHHRKAA